MIRQAFRELRLHPGRFASVLAAIILSIGFLTLTQTFVATETSATAKRQVLWASNADVTVSFQPRIEMSAEQSTDPQAYEKLSKATLAEAEKVISSDAAVSAVSRVATGFAQFTDAQDNDRLLSWITVPEAKPLQWAQATEGRLPTAATEIAIPKDLAKSAQLKIGDTIDLTPSGLTRLTIVGLTDESTLFASPVMVSAKLVQENPAMASATGSNWAIKATSPGEVDGLIQRLDSKLRPLAETGDDSLKVLTGRATLDKALSDMAGDMNVTATMVGIFGVIALLVGAIIIATTFAILVAQRRRQTGLLRAVGASRRQVFNRFLGEAIVVGAVGSLLGILLGVACSALLSAFATRSLVYGMVIPWGTLVGIFLVGVLVTVLAALVPMRRSMQVAPLEALRPVESEVQRRRGRWVQGILCGLLLAAGLVAAYLAVTVGKPVEGKENTGGSVGVLLALLAGVLITVGVLASATLYIPLILRGLGALFSPLGPTARLAALNSRRNPGRAGATAVALMLAVGLIVTLQVGQASVKATANHELDAHYPIDLVVVDEGHDPKTGNPVSRPFTPADVAKVRGVQGIDKAVLVDVVALPGIKINDAKGQELVAMSPMVLTPEAIDALPADPGIEDGELGIDPQSFSGVAKVGDKVTFGSTTVTIVKAPYPEGVITPGTLAKAGGKTSPLKVVAQIGNDKDALKISKQVARALTPAHPDVRADGGAVMKALLGQVLDTLLLVLLALLGVATVIALLGVGNTLGLSVLERTRESALLRALGLQAGQLRIMLLVEAIMLALAGTIVGVAFGMFFGWLGIKAVMNAIGWGNVVLSISWPMTLGVIALALVAAVLGSILPGRKAAKAAPVEALADVG